MAHFEWPLIYFQWSFCSEVAMDLRPWRQFALRASRDWVAWVGPWKCGCWAQLLSVSSDPRHGQMMSDGRSVVTTRQDDLQVRCTLHVSRSRRIAELLETSASSASAVWLWVSDILWGQSFFWPFALWSCSLAFPSSFAGTWAFSSWDCEVGHV